MRRTGLLWITIALSTTTVLLASATPLLWIGSERPLQNPANRDFSYILNVFARVRQFLTGQGRSIGEVQHFPFTYQTRFISRLDQRWATAQVAVPDPAGIWEELKHGRIVYGSMPEGIRWAFRYYAYDKIKKAAKGSFYLDRHFDKTPGGRFTDLRKAVDEMDPSWVKRMVRVFRPTISDLPLYIKEREPGAMFDLLAAHDYIDLERPQKAY